MQQVAPHLTGLQIITAKATPSDENFIPKTWPPAPDFPITIDQSGIVLSRYSDPIWDITPWANRTLKLNFGDGKVRKDVKAIDRDNADLFRLLIAYMIYSPRGIRSAKTLMSQFEMLRPLFIFCTEKRILASDLYRYPRAIEELTECLWGSFINRIFSLLDFIWLERNTLGFYILDPAALSLFERHTRAHQKSQTAYIPPRIWTYQVERLNQCLQDFKNHENEIVECYNFCMNAYITNAGSLVKACSNILPEKQRPFRNYNHNPIDRSKKHLRYHGPFRETAAAHGIDDLLERWLGDYSVAGVPVLASYFSLVSQVAQAYILNFTLMRADEATKIRFNCLKYEKDPVTGEEIYLIKGATSKTIDDDDAHWITSPSSKIAIDVLRIISGLRILAAQANPIVPCTPEDLANPPLQLRPYEPWRRKSDYLSLPLSVKPAMQTYALLLSRMPLLFESEKISITDEDLNMARLITPTLDPNEFAVGKPWPFTWHQLRRTGAVNMASSGLVSDPSLQYQLKHASRAMTRYYGQGFYHLQSRLDPDAKAEFLRTRYEMIAREFAAIQSPRFISPHGEKRKLQILNLLSANDHGVLVKAAKMGEIVYRPIFFGGCTNPSPCPYGGFDAVSTCGGGDGKPPCKFVMYDRDKLPKIKRLRDILRDQLAAEDLNSHRSQAYKFQMTAIENAIHVIENN